MSNRHISNIYDDSDDADLSILGSRFIHAVQDHNRRGPDRFRRESDPQERRGHRAKPRPVRDRGY